MPRVKTGIVRRKRHKKVLKEAKGYRGAIKTNYKKANEAVKKAMAYATEHRKLKKRKMRELWIIRINAAARANGINYSNLMNGLKKSGVELNRKMLSEMAIYDAAGFAELCELAKKAN